MAKPRLAHLIGRIEMGFTIKHGWVAVFTGLDKFNWHRDTGYHADYRIIFTLGAVGKR